MMKPEVCYVTPDMARKWLTRNITNNRNINENRVAAYAEEMRANNWIPNGQAIQFDEGGLLIDGQHRLKALIRSGKTVQMLVVRGVPRNAVEVIDTMQPRSLAQIQKINGVDGLRSDKRVIAMCGAHRRDVMGKSGSINVREFTHWFNAHQEAINVIIKDVGVSYAGGNTNGTRAAVNVALMLAYESGVSSVTLKAFVDAYKYTIAGDERNKWPIKLSVDAHKYTGNSIHCKMLEELAERYIFAFANNLKSMPKPGRRYTEHDVD